MSSAASLLQGQGSHSTAAPVRLPLEVLKRRAGQRRQMLAVQGVSYALITSVLLVYCYAGTIPIIIPSAYFLSGIGLVSVFVVLSEAHFNDRFEDHYLDDLPGCRPRRAPALLSAGGAAKSDLPS